MKREGDAVVCSVLCLNEKRGMSGRQTAIITGGAGGIGTGLVEGFLDEGYNVVATSRDANRKLAGSSNLILIDGDIGKQQTSAEVVEAAVNNYGTIDVLVNNAGIFLNKPFTDFTAEDLNSLFSTNLLGFFYITQRAVKEMLKQKSGCVVSITAALADRPIAGVNGSMSMITKGGLNSATQTLAIEYAKDGIRFNAVAPGVVDTPMHPSDPKDSTQPTMKKATVKDVVDAVLYLARAGHVSGEILHVDGAAPARRW
jgi:NAD(P)-dependent dehydrogenase (short-subunit alcohol dehydrogenase family)